MLQVYGETSFELICQILDKLSPVGPDNKFIDLGSGVGQVVLQVAALTDCEMTFGIEKASTPANYAKVCNFIPPSVETKAIKIKFPPRTTLELFSFDN